MLNSQSNNTCTESTIMFGLKLPRFFTRIYCEEKSAEISNLTYTWTSSNRFYIVQPYLKALLHHLYFVKLEIPLMDHRYQNLFILIVANCCKSKENILISMVYYCNYSIMQFISLISYFIALFHIFQIFNSAEMQIFLLRNRRNDLRNHFHAKQSDLHFVASFIHKILFVWLTTKKRRK